MTRIIIAALLLTTPALAQHTVGSGGPCSPDDVRQGICWTGPVNEVSVRSMPNAAFQAQLDRIERMLRRLMEERCRP